MTAGKQAELQIVWHQVTVIERFSSVLYPLDILELLKQIPTIGYVVPELVLRGTLEAGKPIATKGDVELIIDQDKKTVGVKGRDPDNAVESFQELRQFCLERLDPSPGLTTQYVEFDGQGWAKSEKDPTEICSRFWASYTPLRDLGRMLEADVTNFGLQLVPSNKDPNDPEWFHIYIEPLIFSSRRRYRLRCIWRGSDLEQLLMKFSKVEDSLERLISKIEG
ncbi:MAG: hypothetical protein KAX23_03735 [Dehalococcoidia bacterium]|jgi:hypothetical protein|nr:hypothetical protein [Chloroflexota bacterium]MCK4242642.1 hypothetical protein [Dehalococcoidia bacterium]